MITLRQLPYIDIMSLEAMMSFDTKVNILDHCKLAHIDIPKSWRKAHIGEALADLFTNDPLWTIKHLPQEELGLLKRLLSLSPEEYITYPRNDEKYLLMQKLHLVVTYEGLNEWQIYMPRSIRNVLKDVSLDTLIASEPKKKVENCITENTAKDMNLVDILDKYPKLSQVAFFVTLEFVNINLGNKLPYEDFLPYVDDLQSLEEAMMKGAKRETLERYADLLMMDMRTLYGSIEKMMKVMKGKNPSNLSDTQYDNALHCGTMLNAMQQILLRFHKIPSEDLAQMVLANKKKNGLLHFEELEKMAMEITDELLMDLMRFSMMG